MFICPECGHAASKWFGRCPGCGEWAGATESGPGAEPAPVSSLQAPQTEPSRHPSGIAELDRVLGGGYLTGAVMLFAGEPGIGKSTLVLQLLAGMPASTGLLVSGEESAAQVSLRAARLGIGGNSIRVAATTSLEAVLEAAAAERPGVLVIDSIQTLTTAALDHAPGSVTQVRACATALLRYAKSAGVVVVLVGHVTKDGGVAGPKSLEHIVDVVVTLEGERGGTMRLLRATKNRFGPSDETGVFVMTEQGLVGVEDPSAMLLADRPTGVSGSVVFPALEGSRPVLAEIQALVSKGGLPQPRRVALGLEARRLTLLIAVLMRRAMVSFTGLDVFVSAAGGIAVREPASDLAVAIALCSAVRELPVRDDVVVVGEVGLGGEVRRVPGIDRRLAEAARLGFREAIVPRGAGNNRPNFKVTTVDNVVEAFELARGKHTSHLIKVG
jgi:DNA repair protein RadA/Sms